jgi:predicted PurR-regulated permease PerM
MVLGIKFLGIPILLSILVYYTFNGLVDQMESNHIPRSIAILLVFATIGGLVYTIIYIYIPPAIEKLSPFLSYWAKEFENPENNRFSEQVDYLLRLESPILQNAFPPGEMAKSIIGTASEMVDSFIQAIPNLAAILILTPIVSFFLLLDAHSIYKNFVAVVPNRYFEMTLLITHKINLQITSYLKGLIIQSSIMAVVGSIGFYAFGLKFFIIFGIFLGIANVIPYLGPIIGLIPPAIFALVTGGGLEAVIPILLVVLACQLIDNLLIQPTVIAQSAALHPILVLIGITVGGNLLGLWGMLIAIPLLSVLKVTLSILYKSLKEHGVL